MSTTVVFEHCGVCGWHYRYYAVQPNGTRSYLAEDSWDPEWDTYGTDEAYGQARAHLVNRCLELAAAIDGERRAV